MKGGLTLVCFSDTHGQHRDLKVPEGDMLLFAGDMTTDGQFSTENDFLDWWEEQPHQFKFMIAGNHDSNFYTKNERRDHYALNDDLWEGYGLKIWGHPWTPRFGGWSWMMDRGGEELRRKVGQIPLDVNIILSHGPPYGACDNLEPDSRGDPVTHLGCDLLANAVRVIQPRYVICGHIHEGDGADSIGGTTVVNCAVLNDRYELVNSPIVVSI